MAEVLVWGPGALKQPGDLVRPTNSGVVTQTPLDNGSFDDGDTGWTESGSGSWTIDTGAPVFDGTFSGKAGFSSNPNNQTLTVTNDEVLTCVPGQIVVARAFIFSPTGGDPSRAQFQIQWYNSGMAPLAPSKLALDPTQIGGHAIVDANGLLSYACREIWLPIEVEGIAPAGAAFFQIQFVFLWADMAFAIDGVLIDYANVEDANTLIFRAVQSAAGFTGNNEPTWPDTIGQQVVDNEVTWEAVSGTSVTWQASRILVTGAIEPTWPLLAGGAAPDNTISWVLDSRRVTDSRVPNDSEIVMLAASKIYAGDVDIIRYSATVNPLDWTTAEDAGFIPFGLNLYGANPITAMGLYRGNIAAFNSQGCQIWQVDPDPAAITLLDAIPVPCTFPKSLAPVGDDLAFLTNKGIRSLGVAGANVNLSGGYFGKQVDPLVVAAIAEAATEGWTPRGLYWPAKGQYWLFFGAQAFVLTIAGPKSDQRSWARYTFPTVVDAWTILGEDLLLRSGDLVWTVDADALVDDMQGDANEIEAGTDTLVAQVIFGYQSAALNTALGGAGAQVGDIASTSFADRTLAGLWVNYSATTGLFSDVSLVLEGVTTPAADVFESFVFGGVTLSSDDATTSTGGSLPANSRRWVWASPGVELEDGEDYAFAIGIGFNSEIQWPFLDMGNLAADKELCGYDLSIDGDLEISFGWDQRHTEFNEAADTTWTEPFAVSGDTMPGNETQPISLTSNSFAMRLVFDQGQRWMWYSAAMWMKDLE